VIVELVVPVPVTEYTISVMGVLIHTVGVVVPEVQLMPGNVFTVMMPVVAVPVNVPRDVVTVNVNVPVAVG